MSYSLTYQLYQGKNEKYNQGYQGDCKINWTQRLFFSNPEWQIIAGIKQLPLEQLI